jgi:hypothetical protein
VITLGVLGTYAAAQGHGKPSQTGIEHTETVANPKGVEHGIDNAESKQAAHHKSAKARKHKSHKKAAASTAVH